MRTYECENNEGTKCHIMFVATDVITDLWRRVVDWRGLKRIRLRGGIYGRSGGVRIVKRSGGTDGVEVVAGDAT